MRLNRLLAGVAILAMAATAVTAQTPPRQDGPVEVEIDQGVLRPFQIAVADFNGQNGSELAQVIRSDLRRSGYFEPLDPAGFVETGLTVANAPNFPQWTSIGAQAVLYGSVSRRPDNRNDYGFRLYDPTASASWLPIASPRPPSSGAASATRSPTWSTSA